VSRPTITHITPPRLASLPEERAQLEYSSRSIVFTEDGLRLLRAWGTPEHPWVLAVEPSGSRWRVESWGASPTEARAAARALFSLDHPIEEFYRLVRKEPILRGTDRRFRGLRLPRDPTVYEALLYAVIGQQLSVRAARAVQLRLFERTSSVLEVDGVEVRCVPKPRAILGLGEAGLRSVGTSRAKARTLLALAEWAPGAPSGDTFANGPLEPAVARLDALPGIGPWTAENALLRGAGRKDVFVAGDLGIRVGLEEYGGPARAAPESEARAWAGRHYPGWGSYATLYLWRKLVADRTAAASG
jgi:DNA-3-methyladenine glycosylase II